MSEETKDVPQEKEAPADSSPEQKTNPDSSADAKQQQAPATGDAPESGVEEKKDDEMRIPKHRFDEVNDKMKRLEQDNATLQNRFQALGNAITGGDKAAVEDDIEIVSKKHNIQSDFIKDVVSVAEKRAAAKFEKNLTPYKQAQVESHYQQQVADLVTVDPDAAYMSDEDKTELKKMAFDKKYLTVPVPDLYKILTHGRPKGHNKTVESSRAGGGRDRSSIDEVPDFANMSTEDFKAYSAELIKAEKLNNK